ncbi:SIMPL domain-containing protein [Alteribacillus sp. HJP-4]|uniref:SIMPL domain-containing protein n=1 Tax=Alteribacillus sp. HJP-4 TaxID=2775394 RepID=UPI0035CD327F
MKRIRWRYIRVTSIFIIACIVVLFQGTNSDSYQKAEAGEESIQDGTIVVRGEGKISVDPDIAIIHAGAEATDSSAERAQEKVSKNMQAVREQLDAYGITKENRETIHAGVHPEHNSTNEGKEQYRAQHVLKIEYEEINSVGELLDDLAAAGANRIDQTQFSLIDQTKAESDALREAVERTKGKAAAMAEAAGKTNGGVIQIAEGEAYSILPENSLAMDSAEGTGTEPGTLVEAGEVQVIKQVKVVYELK